MLQRLVYHLKYDRTDTRSQIDNGFAGKTGKIIQNNFGIERNREKILDWKQTYEAHPGIITKSMGHKGSQIIQSKEHCPIVRVL